MSKILNGISRFIALCTICFCVEQFMVVVWRRFMKNIVVYEPPIDRMRRSVDFSRYSRPTGPSFSDWFEEEERRDR